VLNVKPTGEVVVRGKGVVMRSHPMRRAHLGSAAAILLTALVLSPPAAQAQWDKPIDWLFHCTALVEAKWGADSRVCADVLRQGGIKSTLDDASSLLESLGFASPAISANLDLAHHMEGASADWQALQLANERDPRCEARYCAWLVYGLRKDGAYSFRDSSLVLDPFRITADGLPEPGYDESFGFAEVHELFHAVQFGYPGVGKAADSDWVDWILEGTAEHVARAVGRPVGLSVGGSAWFRTYDRPLHSPPTEDPDDPTFEAWAYGSWEFFDFLGDYLDSDQGIQYLVSLFQNLAPGQNNGLEAVEVAVQHESGRGLYEAFPEFVARRLIYPCYFRDLGTWKGGDCADGPDNEYRFELTVPDTVRHLDHTVPPVAANGYLVRLEIPEGNHGLLTIRVPRGADDEYLHLVVDDERRDASGIVGHRNEYTTVLPGGPHEFFVRLANVPRDLSDADPAAGLDFSADDPAPIEFMVVEPFAEITSITSSPGPSGADVDQPLEVRFDKGLQGVVSDAATMGRYDPALAQPCMLRVPGLSNAAGDGLWFGMDHEGPIGPGVYPVADHRRIGIRDPVPAGRVDAVFRLGFLNQPPAEQLQEFVGTAGSLTMKVVSGRFVLGTLEVVGENSRAKDIALGRKEPPANYLPNAVIRVEFGLLMSDPGEPVRNSGARDCLTSISPGPQAVSGNGGGPVEPTQPGADAPDDPGPPDAPDASGAGGAAPTPSTAEPEEPGAPPSTEGSDASGTGARPSEAATATLSPGKARWVSVRVKGRPDLSFQGSDLDGSAGAELSCFGTAGPASLSLHPGPSGQTASLGLMVISSPGIAEGATGSFPLDQVLYVVGGGTLGWRGPATLEIRRHEASTDRGSRRLAGRILGLSVIDRATGARLPVDAEFDVNAACAPFGR